MAAKKIRKTKEQIIEEYEDKLLDLQTKYEGDLIHLKQEKTSLNRQVKLLQKDDSLYRYVQQDLENLITPVKPLPTTQAWNRSGRKKIIEEDLVMHLSDGHHDEIVIPEQVDGIEQHDFEISCGRAEIYVEETLNYCLNTLSNYRFKNLWILAYGDHTSGEIHGAVEKSHYKNQFKNCLAIGQLHSMMIRDLAPHFERVNVVYLSGNHGRRTPKKDHNGPQNNWDYLIGKLAESHCKNLTNVNFLIPDAFSIGLNINGHGFHVEHGDDIKSWNGIPFYGIERKSKRLTALKNSRNMNTKYFVFGHFHKNTISADLEGETIINGAWVATSAYAYNSFSGYARPTQLLHGVHPENGISWRLPINLDQRDVRDDYRNIIEPFKGDRYYKSIDI